MRVDLARSMAIPMHGNYQKRDAGRNGKGQKDTFARLNRAP
jgi:hypothetical protein